MHHHNANYIKWQTIPLNLIPTYTFTLKHSQIAPILFHAIRDRYLFDYHRGVGGFSDC